MFISYNVHMIKKEHTHKQNGKNSHPTDCQCFCTVIEP